MTMLLKIILLGNQNENLEIPPSSAVFSLCNIDYVHMHTKTKCPPYQTNNHWQNTNLLQNHLGTEPPPKSAKPWAKRCAALGPASDNQLLL